MHSRVIEPGVAAYGRYIGKQDLFLWQMVWISENPCSLWALNFSLISQIDTDGLDHYWNLTIIN